MKGLHILQLVAVGRVIYYPEVSYPVAIRRDHLLVFWGLGLQQWRNVGGLARMAPLGGKKRPLVAPLGYKLTRSNF